MIRLIKQLLRPAYKASYAQCGEDLICAYILRDIFGIQHPQYLDIGAHHPTSLSNTYLFYRQGCRGVCVEPDPFLSEIIARKRPRDTCLNVGIGPESQESVEFYVMNFRTLSTFSKAEAERCATRPEYRIENVISVPLMSINRVISDHFTHAPNLISLDTEGYDLEIIRALDFDNYRPEVFCIETVEHVTEKKIPDIMEWMGSKGYQVYADTFINTIFVEGNRWERRMEPQDTRPMT